MAKSRFAKFFESIQKVSLNKVSLVVPLVLSFYALYQTCQNLEITERSANESKRSADVAQEALALQQQQYKDFKENEELRRIEDSEKQRKDIELTEQQISALKTQADALNRGVRNTEISQRPELDIINFGFHYIEAKKVIWYYEVKNFGVRPANLKKVTMTIFDKNYQKVKSQFEIPNIPLVGDKIHRIIIPLNFVGNQPAPLEEEDVYKFESYYFLFAFEYNDLQKNTFVNTENKPITYKWVKKDGAYYALKNEYDRYFPFEPCNDVEKETLIESYNKTKKGN